MARSHITVCICTYKRPELLAPLLAGLQDQRTDGRFTYSVVVADNDAGESARPVVASALESGRLQIDYHVEPERNIALARNKAVQNATGDFIACIDDDEVPGGEWLYRLHEACLRYKADAVLGPVIPRFETEPPRWIVRGHLLERPTYPSGTVLRWSDTRTGNVLLRQQVFEPAQNRFRAEFRHAEDLDFFKRLSQQGYALVWCHEAPVYEIQRVERFTLGYFLRRALLRGNVSLKLKSNKFLAVLKSAVALFIYTLSLPLLAVVGQHLFIVYLIKDCDHIGRIMAGCRIDIQRYLA